jgi:hypothetical protein
MGPAPRRGAASTFVTVGDWVHGLGSVGEILGIAGAALVLAGLLPRRWAAYSATGSAILVGVLAWQAVPYPWVGTAERLFALVIVGWVAALGAHLATKGPAPSPAEGDRALELLQAAGRATAGQREGALGL